MNSSTAWVWITTRAAPDTAGTTTSPLSPLPRPSSLLGGSSPKLHASLTFYQVLDAIQDLLRCWTCTSTTCGRTLTSSSIESRTSRSAARPGDYDVITGQRCPVSHGLLTHATTCPGHPRRMVAHPRLQE